METSISLPLDDDGFLRRECPHCLRQFKWHNGPANEEAEQQPTPPAYYCPLCGQPAGQDSWWTHEQLEYAEGMAAPMVAQAVEEELKSAFKSSRSKSLRIEMTGHMDTPDLPLPLVEQNDMMMVVSPCHSWEPIKVPDDHTGALHCLVCGSAFAI